MSKLFKNADGVVTNAPIDDGGPAFPTAAHEEDSASGLHFVPFALGMSIRDWFAGQAIAGLALTETASENVAHWAYHVADALLAERKKEKP